MRYFVKWEVRSSLGEADMPRLKKEIVSQLEYIEKSGKMKDGGQLFGVRGGYFIFDVEKPSELYSLIGSVIWDNCHVESHPVVTYKELNEYLREDIKKAA